MTPTIQYQLSGPLAPEELAPLLESAGMRSYTPEKLGRVISGSSSYVTARDGGMLVGFGRLLSDGATLAYINSMAVSPEYRGQGIGQAILERLIEAAGDVSSIFLYTNSADSLYLRNGFQASEKRLYVCRR
jgi:N-acetylglutamate synthase-like GNAT family acetyltransferase